MPSDVLMIESLESAVAMLKPLRVNLLREMTEPRTCTELAEAFGLTPQKVYYHVKTMEQTGLVERVDERLVNGISEGFYQARARSFWLSPSLLRSLGGRRATRDQTSLGLLAGHAEEVLEDVGQLAQRSEAGEEIPSLSLSVEIGLDPERRREFMTDLRQTFEALAHKYSRSRGDDHGETDSFRFALLCYPHPEEENR